MAVALVGLLIGGAGQAQQDNGTPGVTEDTIKLGSFIAQSGPVSSIGIPFSRGARAWYNWVNDHGGVNGRQIDFTICDDSFVPSNTVSCVERLLQEENVFAIANPLGTAPIKAVIDTLVEQNVPMVSPGANATFLAEPTKPNVFALQPTNKRFGTFAASYPVDELGMKNVAAVFVDNAFGNELVKSFKATLAEKGLEPARTIGHSADTTDFSNIVLQLQQANPDAVALLEDSVESAAAIMREAENLGFDTQFIGLNTTTDPKLFELAGASAVEGMIAPGFAEFPTTDLPSAQLYRHVLQDPETGFPDEPAGGFSEIAYVGAQLVTHALAKTMNTHDSLTRENFIDTLESIDNWSNGLTPPISYSPDNHAGIQELFVVKVQDGEFTNIGSF
ncbi:MAG: ABC transporter substrate-binding protein [Candidatus Bipolaricaulia bacterium]